MRRWVSTTLNFFYWKNLPFPIADPNSQLAGHLARLAQAASGLTESSGTAELHGRRVQLESVRAELDARVALSFGLSPEQFDLVLGDFPLVDRRQPSVDGKPSQITKDTARLWFLNLSGGADKEIAASQSRIDAAHARGAVGYLPAELT
jgi:hypothetical protein